MHSYMNDANHGPLPGRNIWGPVSCCPHRIPGGDGWEPVAEDRGAPRGDPFQGDLRGRHKYTEGVRREGDAHIGQTRSTPSQLVTVRTFVDAETTSQRLSSAWGGRPEPNMMKMRTRFIRHHAPIKPPLDVFGKENRSLGAPCLR